MRLPIYALVIAALLGAAAHADADTFCVADATMLQSALNVASANSANNTIRVQAGTYPAPASGFRYSRATGTFSLDLEGGWNAGCVAQTPDASLTVLDGQALTNVLVSIDNSDPGSDMTIRYFTILNGTATAIPPALSAYAPGALTVENCRFRLANADASTNNTSTLQIGTARGPIYFVNNIVANNSALASDHMATFFLGVGAASSVPFYINANTVADNTFNSLPSNSGAIGLQPAASSFLANNILWGNGGNEFAQNTIVSAVLVNNDIDVLNITSAPGSSGNVNVDPRFVGLNNHHLQLTTPLYNEGAAAPSGGGSMFDLDGNPRVAFGAVDIGAYELQVQPDEIFANDFE